jgi:hypothetical protein
LVDPFAIGAGALVKAVESAADEGAKDSGGLVSRVFGPAADEIGQALARWTAYRVGNLQRIANVADQKSAAAGRDGIVNPRVVRSLLDECSYCADELMGEYLGGLLAGGRSPGGEDDRAVGWTAMIASMSAIQVRLHFILYREWAFKLAGLRDKPVNQSQKLARMIVDAEQVVAALREGYADIGSQTSIARHALAGLSRLDLVSSNWHIGPVPVLRKKAWKAPVPDLPFEVAIGVIPTHAGMELYGWACGLPGQSFSDFMSRSDVIEFDVRTPRPTAFFPGLDLPADALDLDEAPGDNC